MGHAWSHFRTPLNSQIFLEQCWNHFGTIAKSCWHNVKISLKHFYNMVCDYCQKNATTMILLFFGGGQFWNHVGAILKIRLRYSSNMMGKFWNHFGTMLKSWWINFEIILGQLWNLYWTILKSFVGQVWNHVGTILKSFWNNFGMLLG